MESTLSDRMDCNGGIYSWPRVLKMAQGTYPSKSLYPSYCAFTIMEGLLLTIYSRNRIGAASCVHFVYLSLFL